MRILHIVGSINPAAGGPTEAIRMIILYRPPGYEAEVVTLDSPDAPFLADFPFQVHALGNRKKSWYSPRLIPWLKKNLDRFDGIIVHGLWEFTGLATMLAVAGHKPYLVFTHGMLDPYFKRRYPLKHVKKWIYWILAQYWVLRAASRVMFTTELERDLATRSFWLWHWNPMVVSYGADPQMPDIDELVPAFYHRCPELNVEDAGRSYLLFLSRIHPKKGCDLLLQAFAAVAPAHPELHLIMAGPDATGMRKDLEKIVEQAGLTHRVHWPGMLKGDAKWGAFAVSDAFVLPSHQENFGIAVAEALACGRPVLISDQVNIAPEIEADGCGIVEHDTLEGTIHLLERWLALNPEERHAMQQQARITFARRYDMRRNSALILRIFERIRTQTPGSIVHEAN
ncbi:MAG: glycosyltransferase [Acidobacteriaceae bacterium]|jgi:glycosyltransferase involved in cell wall biosynthesis